MSHNTVGNDGQMYQNDLVAIGRTEVGSQSTHRKSQNFLQKAAQSPF